MDRGDTCRARRGRPMSLLVGSLTPTKIRVVTPWNGPWFLDAEITLQDTDVPPTGKTTVQVGGATLVGTVDPRATGRMGANAHVRVVGGGGGWDKQAPALEFHNDAGVTSTVVMEATASAVGESRRQGVRLHDAHGWPAEGGVVTMKLNAHTLSRLALEFQAWSESPAGQRILLGLSAATEAHTALVEGLHAVVKLAKEAAAWAESDEGRCFLQAGLRAVEQMHDEGEAPVVRH